MGLSVQRPWLTSSTLHRMKFACEGYGCSHEICCRCSNKRARSLRSASRTRSMYGRFVNAAQAATCRWQSSAHAVLSRMNLLSGGYNNCLLQLWCEASHLPVCRHADACVQACSKTNATLADSPSRLAVWVIGSKDKTFTHTHPTWPACAQHDSSSCCRHCGHP